jgi:hypothetical protein
MAHCGRFAAPAATTNSGTPRGCAGVRHKTTRITREVPHMATVKMPPKKDSIEVDEVRTDQLRAQLHRYRLQIDRQTKDSFADKAEAEKRAKAIKKAHPVVHVTIYDAENEERTIVEA